MVRAQQTMRQPWKVPTHMPPWLVPISCAIRWRISAAALLVNVTAIIEYGEQFSTLCSQAIR